jgi:hypothetical protein
MYEREKRKEKLRYEKQIKGNEWERDIGLRTEA